jgi:flavin-dependent dehydrogenase
MTDHDVVVVGGGPAGCSAAVFTARYGFDTVVFDRGNAALPRCAYLTNYLGFPAGIDVDSFRDLMHAHVEEVGSDIIPERVTAVERTGDSTFTVTTQDGRTVTTTHVVAAAWYDGSYLRPLGVEEMFEMHDHHGEREERFDPEYADGDGRTPLDGLYVAGPADSRSEQAISAAGYGAHVARALIEDTRREEGYAGDIAPEYDWARSDAEFTGEWADRDRWREWFEREMEGHDLADDRLADLRETYIDEAFETKLTDEEVEVRRERGLDRLVDVIGQERVLDAIDDTVLEEYTTARAEHD